MAILYLSDDDHITQCSIAAITLQTLFEFSANLTDRVTSFFMAIEEAHTFIPSAREWTDDGVSYPKFENITVRIMD